MVKNSYVSLSMMNNSKNYLIKTLPLCNSLRNFHLSFSFNFYFCFSNCVSRLKQKTDFVLSWNMSMAVRYDYA